MFTLRYNLGKGKNYMKWKLTSTDGEVQYLDPETTSIWLRDGKFKNRRTSAEKIFNGGNKFVVAWIEADDVLVITDYDTTDEEELYEEVKYNPRVQPYWRDSIDCNIDDSQFSLVKTSKNKLYKIR